jgi:SET domain-containing protein
MSFLDIDTEVRASKTHGKGVFALRDFSPGEIVFAWDTSNTLTDARYEQLTGEQKNYVIRYKGSWLFMTSPSCYINHSCESNTRALNGHDIAIKPITAGEEITSDYRSEMKEGEHMVCRCRTASCVGYIVGTAV